MAIIMHPASCTAVRRVHGHRTSVNIGAERTRREQRLLPRRKRPSQNPRRFPVPLGQDVRVDPERDRGVTVAETPAVVRGSTPAPIICVALK